MSAESRTALPELNLSRWMAGDHLLLMSGQQGQVDQFFAAEKNSVDYNRFQLWMNKAHDIDDYSATTMDVLRENVRQWIEEMDSSDENPFNRWVESLKINRGY